MTADRPRTSSDFQNGYDAGAKVAALILSSAEAQVVRLETAITLMARYADECSDPNGWLATNVRHAAKRALCVSQG